jgi:(p)ppGpp synthase/HD superfamily hydrolase
MQISEKEAIAIEHKHQNLLKACKSCSKDELAWLEKAYTYAASKYGTRRKESGELMILHSLSVAFIVANEIGLKSSSVISALLHDIIDDPGQDDKTIAEYFGEDVAAIVKGFKKLSMFHSNKVSFQSENFRKLFLSMADDVRIIFIKLSHRLHDLRTFHDLPTDLQNLYLKDAIHLYTPIAHRLGLYKIKAELEDLSMKYTFPGQYNEIASTLRETKHQQEAYINRFIEPIKARLTRAGIKFEIKSRTKSIPSIKKKLDAQGVSINEIYDIFAVRVILTDVTSAKDSEFIEDFKKQLEKEGEPNTDKKTKAEKFAERKAAKKPLNHETAEAEIARIEKEKQDFANQFNADKIEYLELLHRERTACWETYSVIADTYQPNPKRLRDWITTPKASGYESLHTTVLGPDNRWVEVQIRTHRMDEVAEKGDAAHWKYKESAYGKSVNEWMLDIRNILDTMGAQRLDDGKISKIEPGTDSIYVFTPNGDLRELKAGATILDFAFDIHSDIGCKCIGAKINDKVYPIRQQLSNGDKVEILTVKNQKPNADWLNYVVTTKAKSRINRALRETKFAEAEAGKEILTRKLKNWKIDFNDRNISRIVKAFHFQKPIDLYYNIAINKVDLLEIKQVFTSIEESEVKEQDFDFGKDAFGDLLESQSEKDENYILIDAGVSGLNYSFAKCCNPIAGDKIFGFITVNHGIKIHRTGCPNAKQMLTKNPYREIEARWKDSKTMKFFVTNLKIVGSDRIALVNDITRIISDDLKVNMKELKFSTSGNNFIGLIKVQIRDADHLGFLKKKLMDIKGVSKVVRFDGRLLEPHAEEADFSELSPNM